MLHFEVEPASQNRWEKLEKHFDEESKCVEEAIDSLLKEISTEKKSVSIFSIDKRLFYSTFHKRFGEVEVGIKTATKEYLMAIEELTLMLQARKDDILTPRVFSQPVDYTESLQSAWKVFEVIRQESNQFTAFLGQAQAQAKADLRLLEVYNFTNIINYRELIEKQKFLKDKRDKAEIDRNNLANEINEKKKLLAVEKGKLNDEEKGAIKVNEYLRKFFGHNFLSLEAQENIPSAVDVKRIKFEVMRGGKKAYHLSEGEQSLLAFCYFLAKLEDINTKGLAPIIWIDDPVSSLDGNHIFFVYSLLNAEVVSPGNFEQLFVSTHNLDFLKYLKKLGGKFINNNGNMQEYDKNYFLINRSGTISTIAPMPKYLKEYVTEFNYLFHQIYKCACINEINDSNYTVFYNFGNNARKFLEVYLYYKYPDGVKECDSERLHEFFGDDSISEFFINRFNNEYSHLCGLLERGAMPIEVPEMVAVAKKIIEKLTIDAKQYEAFCKSVGEDHTRDVHSM